MNEPILTVENLTKAFAGVKALDHVSFSVKRGEVHALMGENGAGKSTLIKIISGLYKADAGRLIFDGRECVFHTTLSAQQAGISTIFQELNLIPYLTIAENIALGRYPMNRGGIDWKGVEEKAQEMVDNFGVNIDVRKPLRSYGTAQQQITAILRAVSIKSKLIIMDEPTSSLDTKEVGILFNIIDKLRADGISVIFISHRLDEVYSKCDSITVLKDGHYIGTYGKNELSQYELLSKMIGQKFALESNKNKRDFSDSEIFLNVRHVTRLPYVNDVSLTIRRGEIVGLAGLLGSGRTETARIVFGCDAPDSGEVLVEGEKLKPHSPKDAMRHGIAFCTENRREEGIFPELSVKNNITICVLPQLTTAGVIRSRAKTQLAKNYINKLAIKTPSDEQLIKNLSGGNQQKVLLARWLATNPKLIILDEPTRGIDVGAKQEIERLICEFSEKGISVLFISSELPELVRNCDRIIVLRDGSAVAELTGDDISEQNVMLAIAAGDSASSKS